MEVSNLTVNAMRLLSCDAIDKAKSGHPGICLGASPLAYTLWQNFLTFNPKSGAKFYNRDRFILSAGHGSMLNYALLHLYGFKLSIEDIKAFRQTGSLTPGHPEFKHTDGVETSTGPLGQGIANAVGMAIAESHLSAVYNKEGFPVVDHYTYALCGDGCLQEGISYEACSLAGTLKLNKLILIYDSNDITIEGNTNIAFTENVKKRFEAQDWQVVEVKDGNDVNALKKAIKKAQAEKTKPSIIICKTQIGYGSSKVGSSDTHGAPLGLEGTQIVRQNLGYNYPLFTVPNEVYAHTKKAINRGKKAEKAWKAMFAKYCEQYPELAKSFVDRMNGKLPEIDFDALYAFEKDDATRGCGGKVLNALAKQVPDLFGGSADLGPSCKTTLKGEGDFTADTRDGRNVHFGVREHAMGAICNGLACHGGFRPFASTFFVFSDYMKNAMRLSALMNVPVTYVLTHDSIGVGEDGPTHQPVEQLVALRSMPNMKVFRPCDHRETAASYEAIIKNGGANSLILTRQTLPSYEGTGKSALKGGYILSDSAKKVPDVILIGAGSEVQYLMQAKDLLKEEGVDARVVSMPCCELFDEQSKAYKESVLPSSVKARVCVEAGSTLSWYKYAGLDGKVLGIDKFGCSGDAKELFKLYGFTAENVKNLALSVIK
ncbi:MAG: transketolase [Clostridia bacterium]|nr:transketolase [Clostridia bacterium]